MSAKFMKNAFVGWTFTAGLYYPPDFDASKLMPMKMLKPKNSQEMLNIRMMFPFTMVCDECHEYNYTGTKFTAKVEMIKGESYLGLKVYRFYGRCRHCWAEFTFKTDPKNSDYTMESGGKRTYEAWKDADMMETELKKEREKDAEQDQMKALEQKSVDVQAEMQRIEDLDAIRTLNKRLGAREKSIDEALDFLFQREEQRRSQEKSSLAEGDMEELVSFREAQEEKKRLQLDAEVEGTSALEDAEARAGTSSSSLSAAALATLAATKKAGSSCGDGASVVSTTANSGSDETLASSRAAGAGAASIAGGAASSNRAAVIAAAIAERASSQAAGRSSGVGARLAVKRKAPEALSPSPPAEEPNEEAAKRPRSAAPDAVQAGAGTPASDAAAGVAAGGALGALGAYDSDSS